MKKNLQKLSRKRSLRLRAKLERKSKKILLLAKLKKVYRRQRQIGHSTAASLHTVRRSMSRDELDAMGNILERMFAPRERARIYYFGR